MSNILVNLDFTIKNEEEYIEKNLFTEQNFRKIKKKLILDIANARIEELSELIIFNNINIKIFRKKNFYFFNNK